MFSKVLWVGLNNKKTEALWIGSMAGNKEKLLPEKNFKWPENKVKGTQSAMGPCWPGQYFSQFEKRLPQPEIKSTRPIHLEIRFNPT